MPSMNCLSLRGLLRVDPKQGVSASSGPHQFWSARGSTSRKRLGMRRFAVAIGVAMGAAIVAMLVAFGVSAAASGSAQPVSFSQAATRRYSDQRDTGTDQHGSVYKHSDSNSTTHRRPTHHGTNDTTRWKPSEQDVAARIMPSVVHIQTGEGVGTGVILVQWAGGDQRPCGRHEQDGTGAPSGRTDGHWTGQRTNVPVDLAVVRLP